VADKVAAGKLDLGRILAEEDMLLLEDMLRRSEVDILGKWAGCKLLEVVEDVWGTPVLCREQQHMSVAVYILEVEDSV